MPNFVFFLLLTVAMALLMNWVFMTYLFDCPSCTQVPTFEDTTASQQQDILDSFCD